MSGSQRNPRANLPGMPCEILEMILGTFCDHCLDPGCSIWSLEWKLENQRRLESLANVSLVCNGTLRDVAQQILHHNFPVRVRSLRNYSRLFLFVRTLINRPNLAEHVRFLGLDARAIHHLAVQAGPSRLAQRDINLLRARGSELSLTEIPHSWQGTSVFGPAYGFAMNLAMLSAKMARVITIVDYPIDCPRAYTDLDLALRSQSSGSPDPDRPLARLSLLFQPEPPEITRSGRSPRTRNPLDKFGSLFKLTPEVGLLELLGCISAEADPIGPLGDEIPAQVHLGLTPPQMANLTRLDLISCALTAREVGATLSSCGNLEKFTFIHDTSPQSWHTAGAFTVTPAGLCQALVSHAPVTLKRLIVDFPSPLWNGGQLTSLRGLLNLEEVYLGCNVLFNQGESHEIDNLAPDFLAGLLPRCVTVLGIFDFHWGTRPEKVEQPLRRFAQHLEDNPGTFSNLRQVQAQDGYFFYNSTSSFRRLEARFAEVNVLFTTKNPAPEPLKGILERMKLYNRVRYFLD
ncbi:hypothetical protein B0T25DRAFT_613021 [Lasiosphaeria hispida]|uniref:Uncharacterized protein n=1 Tax=Lasiosphaeria hispida TaxID=260671 RepID=A0AAJ0HBX3_9PEZI|nr:hypothetical protein B0T25DRAFT_613021 [Lasiosphaeria hispida]